MLIDKVARPLVYIHNRQLRTSWAVKWKIIYICVHLLKILLLIENGPFVVVEGANDRLSGYAS